MLSAIPQEQLAQIVDHTTVPMELRPAFMGWVAPVMLAALGVGLAASSLDAQSSGYISGIVSRTPVETTTNVPPSNVENTNPPPPLRPPIAGLMMPVPPPISPTNPPSTNAVPPPTGAVQPDRPVVVFGLMMTPPANPPPTNATPAEPSPTNPPSVETRTWMPPVHGLP
jgi:hypothetical protein